MHKYFLIILGSIVSFHANVMEITPYIDFKQHTCAKLRTNFNCLKDHQKTDLVSHFTDHKKLALQTALQIPEITHHIIKWMTYDDEQTACLFSTMPFAHALLRLCRIEEIFKSTNNLHLLLEKKRDLALSAYFYFGPQHTKALIYVETAHHLRSIPGEMYEILKKYNFMSEYLDLMIIGIYPALSVCDSYAIPMHEDPEEDRQNPFGCCVII